MIRRWIGSTLGQILAIIACSTLATFLLFVAIVLVPNPPPSPPWPWDEALRITSLVNLLEGVPEDKRKRATLVTSAQRPNLSVTVREPPGEAIVACRGNSLDALDLEGVLLADLRSMPELTVRSCDEAEPERAIQVLVPMGAHVLEIYTGNVGRGPFRFGMPGVGALLFLFVSVTTMSTWAIWRVVRPLRRLSERADAFSRELAPTPIEEEGPSEIRAVARTFNLMQERITRSMHERTRTLAAIGHDLRTPLTRMRLQLETSPRDIDVDKLTRNIDLMQAMVASALGFLRSGLDDEKKEWLDLDALLATLCDEYADSGDDVRYEGPGHIRFHGRPGALQRALFNLVENATQFGTVVTVKATIEEHAITIDVADDGPGIPPQHLRDVLEPFFRLDGSRSDRPGSIGLGLSIVLEIVRAHDGTLTLANAEPHGLVARITLPRPATG